MRRSSAHSPSRSTASAALRPAQRCGQTGRCVRAQQRRVVLLARSAASMLGESAWPHAPAAQYRSVADAVVRAPRIRDVSCQARPRGTPWERRQQFARRCVYRASRPCFSPACRTCSAWRGRGRLQAEAQPGAHPSASNTSAGLGGCRFRAPVTHANMVGNGFARTQASHETRQSFASRSASAMFCEIPLRGGSPKTCAWQRVCRLPGVGAGGRTAAPSTWLSRKGDDALAWIIACVTAM